ncbi:ABC transporter ATP-binding protein [Blastomonas sp.]|uniref:ABC transporter ATP-binding protein n=1 Tax=Blastomonas sp. TaxID=1909299 RepID=UPI003592F018
MLEAKELVAGYGAIPILHGLNLSIADNEYVGILGHNGMGKSTLMQTLIGHIRPMSGSIIMDGNDITGEGSHRRVKKQRIGYVPQGREIFPALTVRENLLMGALSGADRNRNIVNEVLKDFPRLVPLLDRNGGALSGGEQQLLAIARCLCGKPRVMLLDEPTEGIQPSIIDEILDLLLALRKRTSISIILVEQNLDFIQALSDRVLIMQRGEITKTIAPEHLHDPAVISEFVGMA